MSTDLEAAFRNEPVTFLLSNALRHLTQDQQRQLCNALQERLPIPDSIEDEAERLYPFPEDNESGVYDKLKNIREWCCSAHIAAARQYMGEIEKLKDVLHIDQTGLAAGLAEVNKIVEGYRWVTEGRGPYAWNDDKYKEEMGNMLDNISEATTKALNSSGAIAHSVCCGKEGRTATMEGIGYIKKDAHDKEIEQLKAALTKIEGIARRFGNGTDPEKDIELIETIAAEAQK